MTCKGREVIEKVELLQNLIESINAGIMPEEDELSRAKQLGIDVEELMEAFEDDGNH